MVDPTIMLARTANWVILVLVLVAMITAAVLVGRDARRRGRPRASTMAWALLTLFLFPVGAVLYLLERNHFSVSGPDGDPC